VTAVLDARALASRFAKDRDSLLPRDARRLGSLVSRIESGRVDLERLAKDLDRARLAADNRRRLIPERIDYPAELPVSQARGELLEAIRANPVVIVCGETGSGKTTQLPKLCLELGRGARGLIGHTQPRRLAARSVASRIASELGGSVGGLVGYETRFDRRVSEQSLIKLMTDGILLAELQRDRDWLAYDTLIIDEAHERSLNIDFLLGRIRQLLPRRPDLKVIITSATLDPERLSKHFGGAPILSVSGRTYPVETRYRDEPDDAELEDQVAGAVDELWGSKAPDGDVLVFLPGEREIRELSKKLGGRFPRAEVLPLYSRLPVEQQDRVFGRGRLPRIVLATNVAETSVTVPGIRYVVDTGTARINRYNPRLGVQQLHIERISQAAANQRSGRCGRLGPGIAVRLYPREDFEGRPAFTDPEILRSNLAGVILQMAANGLGEIDDFAWVEPPDSRHVTEGYRLLQTLGALDDERHLTKLGRDLARLPLDPRIARIVLAGRGQPGEAAVRVIAAALSVQDPHETPMEQQTQARQKHATWRSERSDYLTLLNLWRNWLRWNSDASQRAVRKICRDQYVSFLRMEEWEQVLRQIHDLMGGPLDLPAAETDEAMSPGIHKALLAGLIDHIGVRLPIEKKGERPEFQGPRARKFRVFPGSALAKRPPEWVMCAQLAHTSQLFGRVVAEVSPAWISEVGDHLVKRTVTHPVWNAERGEVQCTEYHSLFGLQLLKKTKHFGSVDPIAARAMFIREALVAGDWPAKPRFLAHNLRLIADVQDKEARLRRPDLLADEDQLYGFYDSRIPADVCTAATLKRWLRHVSADRGDPGRVLQMTEADVLKPGADADVTQLFPDQLDIAGVRLKLSYHHEPGEEHDGVSFHIPLAQLYQLPPERFDWLVPGLVAARVEALLRSLPMKLRRLCTPAQHFAEAVTARLGKPEGDFQAEVCRHLHDINGVPVTPADFELDRLPAHTRPRLVLEDPSGKVVAESERLADLQAAHRGGARAALVTVAAKDDTAQRWVRKHVTNWDFGDLPESVDLPGGARGYPALVVDGEQVALRLLESPQARDEAHARGVRTLLLAKLNDRTRDLTKTAKQRLGLALVGLGTTPEAMALEVAQRAANVSWDLAALRSEQGFKDALQHRGDFGRRAVALLEDVIGWQASGADLRRKMRGLEGRWPESLADLTAQLDSLLAPGLIEALPEDQWPRVAVWLRAAGIRLDRLPNKPQKDADAVAQLRPLLAALPNPWHPARWLIEEWRVALFAQELRAVGNPTAPRIQAALAA